MKHSSSNIKSEKLGMAIGTAANILRKRILFSLVQETGKDFCFQCGDRIETVEEFSIEHKSPWQNSSDPVRNYFDLDNIAFSHLSCNVRASTRKRGLKLVHGTLQAYQKLHCRCDECVKCKSVSDTAYRKRKNKLGSGSNGANMS
jgi:hypothetical protein